MIISLPEVREAERIAKAQRIAAGRWLRVDESKATSPKDTMLLHRSAPQQPKGPACSMRCCAIWT